MFINPNEKNLLKLFGNGRANKVNMILPVKKILLRVISKTRKESVLIKKILSFFIYTQRI